MPQKRIFFNMILLRPSHLTLKIGSKLQHVLLKSSVYVRYESNRAKWKEYMPRKFFFVLFDMTLTLGL